MNDDLIQKTIQEKNHRDGMFTILSHILEYDKARLEILKDDISILEERISEDETFLAEMLTNYNDLDNNL